MSKTANKAELAGALVQILERAKVCRDLTGSDLDKEAWDVVAKIAHVALGEPSLPAMAKIRQRADAAYDARVYPRITKLGIKITHPADDTHPSGIHRDEFVRTLTPGQLAAWDRWTGGGITVSNAGVYPWDLEAFLAGRPNED